MTFYLRGIFVSFSVFLALYGVLSVAVCCGWRRVWRFGQRRSVERCADLLFVLRITPFVAAVGATLALAVPSFLLFEPRAIDEQMSGWSIVLGITGIAVVLGGLWRMSSLLVKTSQVVSHWSSDARVVNSARLMISQIRFPHFESQRLLPLSLCQAFCGHVCGYRGRHSPL